MTSSDVPASRISAKSPVDVVDDPRGETERELVDNKQLRGHRQHSGQCEHALLASRQRPGQLPSAVGEAGKALEGAPSASPAPLCPSARMKVRRRLSSTSKVANTERPSGACAMPLRTSLQVGRPVTSSPSKRTRPELSGTRPVTTRAMVDFPAPFGPTRAVTTPARIDNETPKSARKRP